LAAAFLSLLAALAGYAFARLNFRGRSFLFFMMLLLVPLPVWVSLIALFQLMSVLGLIDTRLGLILLFVSYGAPLYVWLMQTYIRADRKSTRLNSSHEWISYAVFCLKKKIQQTL